MEQLFNKITYSLSGVYKGMRRERKKSSNSNICMLRNGLDQLRTKKGTFIAAPSFDYEACWIRDQLYSTFAYYFLGETKKFKEGVWVIFDVFKKYKNKIEHVACNRPTHTAQYIHAKYHHEAMNEITDEWGHHQLDAIGLFLYVVGFTHREKCTLIRDEEDKEIIQLLVQYLTAVRYWEFPDNGMWEEGINLHASSIGAVVAGLTLVKDQKLTVVPTSLILHGHETLQWLLPNESPDRETDMALLSLMWPYNIVSPLMQNEILARIKKTLVRTHGLNRYWGDNYYRSDNGMSAEWSMGFFWLSIIYTEKGDKDEAREWFLLGQKTLTPKGDIPELYQNGVPNAHTPLAWAHAMALIAAKKLGLK